MSERFEHVWVVRFKDHGPATVFCKEGKTREQAIKKAIEAVKKSNPLLSELEVIDCVEQKTPLDSIISASKRRGKRGESAD